MGILDAPVIPKDNTGKRLDEFEVAPVTAPGSEAAGILMAKLRRGKSNAVWTHLGDSIALTPSAAGGWVGLVALTLATMFPAFTVRIKHYDVATHTYGSWSTLQTGTGTGNGGGPFVLSIYNGSASGQNASYPVSGAARWAVMVPESPDLVTAAYGANATGSSGDSYRDTHYPLFRTIRDLCPRAGVLAVIQNPFRNDYGEYALGLNRQLVVEQLAANLGIPTVNVLDRFLGTPSYGTALMADHIHPNAAGAQVWADAVLEHLALSERVVPNTSLQPADAFWVSAAQFTALDGSPVLGASDRAPAWRLPNAAESSVVASFHVPASWELFAIHAAFTVPDAASGSGANVAAIRSFSGTLGGNTRSMLDWDNSSNTAGSGSNHQADPGVLFAFSTSGALGAWPTYTKVMSGGSPATGQVQHLRIRRIVGSASDTLPGDAYFLGALITRSR